MYKTTSASLKCCTSPPRRGRRHERKRKDWLSDERSFPASSNGRKCLVTIRLQHVRHPPRISQLHFYPVLNTMLTSAVLVLLSATQAASFAPTHGRAQPVSTSLRATSNLEAILFDCDGVLADTERDGYVCHCDTFPARVSTSLTPRLYIAVTDWHSTEPFN